MVLVDILDLKDYQVTQALVENLVTQVSLVIQVTLDNLDFQGFLDLVVFLDLLDK